MCRCIVGNQTNKQWFPTNKFDKLLVTNIYWIFISEVTSENVQFIFSKLGIYKLSWGWANWRGCTARSNRIYLKWVHNLKGLIFKQYITSNTYGTKWHLSWPAQSGPRRFINMITDLSVCEWQLLDLVSTSNVR